MRTVTRKMTWVLLAVLCVAARPAVAGPQNVPGLKVDKSSIGGTVVNSGGTEYLFSGGTASGTVVLGGGTTVVSSGGIEGSPVISGEPSVPSEVTGKSRPPRSR